MHALVHGTVATGAGAFHPGQDTTQTSTLDSDGSEDDSGANSTQSSIDPNHTMNESQFSEFIPVGSILKYVLNMLTYYL